MELDEQRRFGRTGVSVTPLAVGTGSWGPTKTNEDQAAADARIAPLADAFLAGSLETTVLDTANMYGGGRSEVLVGQAIARAGGVAPGLLVQTKLDRSIPGDRFDGARMRESIRESLDRLGLSNVAVLYLHDPEVIGFDAAMAPGGAVEALVAMKEEGLAAAIGISGGPVAMLQQFVETDLFDALVTHNRWTLLDRSADRLLDAATERGLGITNGAPYGAGVLTGDPRFAGTYGYKPIHPQTQKALDGITAICHEARVPLAAAAIQFSLRESRVHSTIVGVSDRGRWDEAVGHARAVVPAGFWEALDQHIPPADVALDLI